MSHFLSRMLRTAAVAGFAALLAAPLWGQARATGAPSADDSKLELYGGYGWWNPRSNVNGTRFDDQQLYNPNATFGIALYFTRHLGFEVEGGYFSVGRSFSTTTTVGGVTTSTCDTNPCNPVGVRVYTAEGGPIFRHPIGRLIPFVHALGGGARLSGPQFQPLTWGWGVTGGLGIDYVLPYFHGLMAVRPVQADYQFDEVSYGPLVLPAGTTGGFSTIHSLKLSGGLVIRLGGRDMDHTPHGGPMLGCDASPATIYAGDPVTVIASPQNFRPGRPKTYRWVSTGGMLASGEDGATIATAGLPPGDYTVSGTLIQGKAVAKCEASFTVKDVEPTTLSCSADPATVQAGGVSTITATATSAANRTLTYAYTSDTGQITGTGSKVQLATAGVTAQAVNVVCNVVDDLGHTAQARTSVTVLQTAGPSALQSAALPPPLAQWQALCGVSFERDKRRPVRVDNEAKACLDDIALTLQRETDAKLVIVGNFGPGETATEGAERSLNVRQYLTDEKGIEVNRIEVRYGDNSGRTVDDFLLPSGATYDNDKTTAFDPSTVKRVGQPYGKPGQPGARAIHRKHRKPRHHAAAASAAPPAVQ